MKHCLAFSVTNTGHIQVLGNIAQGGKTTIPNKKEKQTLLPQTVIQVFRARGACHCACDGLLAPKCENNVIPKTGNA